MARAKREPDAFPALRLTTNLRIGLDGRQARARTRLKEGDDVFVALSFSSVLTPTTVMPAAASSAFKSRTLHASRVQPAVKSAG